MAGTTSDPAARKRREAIETLIAALVKSSRTIILYKPGHTLIGQVVERVLGMLRGAVGDEPNIQLDIKAKQVLVDEEPLTELPELVSFAVSLHTLGIGQVLLTARLGPEGLEQFMRILTWKADEKRTLSDLQKAVAETRIDGLQIISIMSFIVTGEEEEVVQKIGQLSEEELLALEAARTLPDFLHLLLRQNERLTSREADQLTALFDGALEGLSAVEDLEAQVPWSLYDARVRARWDGLRADLAGRTLWTRAPLVSELSLLDRGDRAFLAGHASHDAGASARHALSSVHALLDSPVGERQPRFALQAYVRLLDDMSRAGNVEGLLGEFGLWRSKSSDPRWGAHLAALRPQVEGVVPRAAVAEGMVRRLSERGAEAGVTEELRDFALSLGPAVMPLLVDELRRTTDKSAQKALSALLAALSHTLGAGAVAEALGDEDYFVVLQALAILDEIGYPQLSEKAAPLLRHPHPKTRSAVVRALGRSGTLPSAIALGAFIGEGEFPEEARLGAMALSQMQGVEAGKLLVAAYGANEDYETRVAIATSLSRQAGPEVESFLESITRQTFRQWLKGLFGRLTGAPRDLREAALRSLAEVRKELHGAKG
ncbi:MAG: HEAT repeat domain-containing protein [Elusimicrobia bacterium]|nr:HEAT repeat domain-containing protein [Elusimicrobiota bacterium]